MISTLTPPRLLAGLLIAAAAWVLHGFVEALLAAAITAVASWPAYAAFRAWLPRRLGRNAAASLFTVGITVFLLAPLVFAAWALVTEAQLMLRGLGLPGWLVTDAAFDAGGAWRLLKQHAEPAALMGWAQALGEFTFRHLLIVAFSVLLLGFFYRHGETLVAEGRQALHRQLGDAADRYLAVAAAAIRASVASMLVVSLFDGLATAAVYAVAGAPRPLLWAAITGALAALPFLGYAAVAALALQMTLQGQAAAAVLVLAAGAAVLLAGDKLVRPLAARDGVHLPFVWVLMGCIGGFGVLGVTGLVMGPVLLALVAEMWVSARRQTARA